MAVNIFGQNHLWPFLNELACFRGLLPEVLEAQAKMMSYSLADSDVTQKQKQLILITQSRFEKETKLHLNFIISLLFKLHQTF